MSRNAAPRRDVHGIVLLDKGLGLSSNRALQRVRGIYRARKAGHTGSLDPLATGMLPICLGEATKVCAYLLDAGKAYRVTARLGQATSTADAEGEVIEQRPVPPLDEALLEQLLTAFRGDIEQVPPMHSAVKHEGKRLYELARKGKNVERKSRQVTISRLELLGWDDQQLELEVECSKGTYIRTLVADLGEALGCGAHVSALHRLWVEGFSGDKMYTEQALDDISSSGLEALDTLMLPVDRALMHLPAVHLSEDSAHYLRQGQAVQVAQLPEGEQLRLYGPEDVFLGIGKRLEDGRVGPQRLFNYPSAAGDD